MNVQSSFSEHMKYSCFWKANFLGRHINSMSRRMTSRPFSWRPMVIQVVQQLRFDRERFADAREWHEAAKELLSRHLAISGSRSISQRLRWNKAIANALHAKSGDALTPRTIHSVKGQEFPGICLVTTSASIRAILDYLESGAPSEVAETRESYTWGHPERKSFLWSLYL